MDLEGMDRRSFLKAGALGAALAASPIARGEERKLAYRTLGRTDMKITTVSLGAFQTTEQAIFEAAFNMGINFVDTARIYLDGRSEGILGKALKGRNDKIYVSTKVWRDNKEKMQKDLDKSMSELMLEQIDLLFLHKCDARDHVFNEDYRAIMTEARKTGKTRYLGVSTHENEVEVIDAVIEDPEKLFDVIMVTYSFEGGDELKQAIARAAKAGLGVLAIKTQAGGYKTKELGDISPHQAALKWVLQDTNITAAVRSMSSIQQLRENTAVMGMPLTPGDTATLKRYGDAIAPYYCHRCGACKAACASHLDIPNINRCLMYAEGYRDIGAARAAYARIPVDARLQACAGCTTCEARCVRGLDLEERMRTARALLT